MTEMMAVRIYNDRFRIQTITHICLILQFIFNFVARPLEDDMKIRLESDWKKEFECTHYKAIFR